MADADEVMAALPRPDGVSYAGLVMNDRGLDRALAAGVHEVDVVVVATDTFCLRNQGVTTEEACRQAASLVERAREAGVLTTVTVGAAFGCPFEGEVPDERLRDVLGRVADAGPDELALADTIGVAVPSQVSSRLALAAEVAGTDVPLRLHLHDTRHTGVANAVAAHRGWRPHPRRQHRRHRRLPVRPQRHGQRRHRGPRLPLRPDGRQHRPGPRDHHGHHRLAGGAAGQAPPRSAAPGRRLPGSGPVAPARRRP